MEQDEFQSHFCEATDDDREIINKSKNKYFLIASKIKRVLLCNIRRRIYFLARASNASGWFPHISLMIDGLLPNADVTPNTGRVLHIYYRHVHEKTNMISRDPNKLRPVWFSYESCFRNLMDTIRLDPQGNRVKIIIVYDGTLEDFNDDFIADYYANKSFGLDMRFIRGGSNGNSFVITSGMVKNAQMPGSDLIYLLENDYLHQPGWVSKLFELYDSGYNFDYAALYDHPYSRKLYDFFMPTNLSTHVIHSRSHHWRTASSTCASFIVDKHTFDRDYNILMSGNHDYHLFEKLLSKSGRRLLISVPGLSTHSMEELLSPTVDWGKISAMKSSDDISKNDTSNNK